MKFNAVVGNPPYQENISSSKGNTSLSRQLFPAFIQNSINLQPKYVSLITPARWFAGDAQDKSFLRLRDFLRENNHISKIYFYEDEKELFNNVTIKGGLTYFLYDKNHKGELDFINIDIENNIYSQKRNLFEDDLDVVISNGKDFPILQKVRNKDFISLTTITKGRNAFGIVGKESVVNKVSKPAKFNGAVPLRCKSNEIRWINPEIVKKNRKIFESYKVFIAKSAGDPKKDRRVLSRPYVAEPFSASTDTFIPIGSFDNKIEAINLQKYIRTKFLRFMVSILKVSQNVYQNVYQFVPLQDFTNESDIPWDKSTNDIDQTLYKKYSLTDEEIEYMKNKIEEM